MNTQAFPSSLAGLVLFLVALSAGCGQQSVASSANAPAVKIVEPAEQPASEPAAAEPDPSLAQSEAPIAVVETSAPASSQTQARQPQPAKGKRPPPDRTPARPGDAEKITFDDLNLGMKEDMVFRPFLITDRVKELDGKRVRVTGFIHGAAASTKSFDEFVLLKNTECKFGAGGQADHLAMVYLAKGQTTKYQLEAVKVEGTLNVKPFQGPDGNTWSVYDLTDARVVP